MKPEFSTLQNMSNVKAAETNPQTYALLHHSSICPYIILPGFSSHGVSLLKLLYVFIMLLVRTTCSFQAYPSWLFLAY